MAVGDMLTFALYTALITTLMDIITFSVFYYIIFPNIITNKKKAISLAVGIVYLILFGFVWILVYHAIGRIDTLEGSIMVYKASISHQLTGTIYAIVLRLSVDWVKKLEQQKELEKQNSKMKFLLLRSQINPHFLFNTLKTIDSFFDKNPAKASFAIIKLSEIMRYMLYEANNEKVLLDKEIGHIKNFIAVQNLSHSEIALVKFSIKGETSNILVAPMIFLPFIEKAFKYGNLTQKESITIIFRLNDDEIYFECRNFITEYPETKKFVRSENSTENIRQRLELTYPARHLLEVENGENIYHVKLKIMNKQST